MKSDWATNSRYDSQTEFAEVQSQNSVTADGSLLSPTGVCKHYTSNTEKWLRKFYMKTMATV